MHLGRQLRTRRFGYFNLEQRTLHPLDNPFGTSLSPMSQVRSVFGMELESISRARRALRRGGLRSSQS